MNRLNQAYSFIGATDRPSFNNEAREKIMFLVKEINMVYRAHQLKDSTITCDICGKGDNDWKFKAKDVIKGYENRKEESPRLCYNHSAGWSISFNSLLDKKITDDKEITFEEIDLHFAVFLAKQLSKEAKLIKQMEKVK